MLSPAFKLKSLPLAALLSATALQSAWAWEADAVAARYKTLLGEQGIEANWSGVRQDGNSVILEEFNLGLSSIDKTVDLGEFVLQDVSESDLGYEIGRVALDDFNHAQDGVNVTVSGLTVDGLVLPKEGADNPYGGMMQYRHLSLASLKVGKGGPEPVFTLDGLTAETTLNESQGLLEFTGSADRFWVDARALADDPKAGAAMEEYGYEQLSGRVDMEGNWRPEDGRMTLTRYDATVDDAGTLGIKADISGYTPEFIKALQEIQKKMESASQDQQQAQGLAMLGLMQQLNLHGASIRFSDASLTQKILSYVAAQQGIEPADVANQAKAIVPLMAGQYLGPELTQSLSTALAAYMDDPKSLEIRLAPAEPMPFAVLMGSAMGSPEALAKQVGLEVVANQ